VCFEFIETAGEKPKMDKVASNIWEELGRREALIRDAYDKAKVILKPRQGLALALEEANALAANLKSAKTFSDATARETAQAFHVIYSIAESIELCLQSGLDISRQLSQMATGTTDFGTPSKRNGKIYFKDFEYELFVASCLIRRGLKPRFLEDRSDPMGEMSVDGIVIECKHPNSNGQIESNISKFALKLREVGKFGVFAIAVEDVHHLGDREAFASDLEYQVWLEAKRDEMELYGLRRAAIASRFDNILGLIHTQSMVEVVGGHTRMSRLGSSVLFDRPTHDLTKARTIAEAFNPQPVLYSQVQHTETPVPEPQAT
jgi:hypothetical protein